VKVHDCAHCGVRLILAKGVPALNAFPDPLGTVAAFQDARLIWHGRFLAAAGPEPAPPEKRYSVHECEGTRHAAQRAQWKNALADQARAGRNRRGTRPAPQITGVVVQPPTLPGLGDK
jgi:hypothetical protein